MPDAHEAIRKQAHQYPRYRLSNFLSMSAKLRDSVNSSHLSFSPIPITSSFCKHGGTAPLVLIVQCDCVRVGGGKAHERE